MRILGVDIGSRTVDVVVPDEAQIVGAYGAAHSALA